jgi:hypothetical protein
MDNVTKEIKELRKVKLALEKALRLKEQVIDRGMAQTELDALLKQLKSAKNYLNKAREAIER